MAEGSEPKLIDARGSASGWKELGWGEGEEGDFGTSETLELWNCQTLEVLVSSCKAYKAHQTLQVPKIENCQSSTNLELQFPKFHRLKLLTKIRSSKF